VTRIVQSEDRLKTLDGVPPPVPVQENDINVRLNGNLGLNHEMKIAPYEYPVSLGGVVVWDGSGNCSGYKRTRVFLPLLVRYSCVLMSPIRAILSAFYTLPIPQSPTEIARCAEAGSREDSLSDQKDAQYFC
jgi:hypothetical protein